MLAQLADDVFSSSALAPHDLLTSLLSEYQTTRKRIEQTANYMQGDPQGVLRFFVEGNCTRERGGLPDIKRLFDAVGAIAALNSHFWERTMQLTDILDTMPQARRTEWLAPGTPSGRHLTTAQATSRLRTPRTNRAYDVRKT